MLLDLINAATAKDARVAAAILAPDADEAARAGAVKAAKEKGGAIAIEFAKFNDGRGYSIARLLREREGFEGEVRARGPLIPDLASFLMRSGFDTVEVPDAHADVAVWQASLSRMGHAYQTSWRNPQTLRRDYRKSA